MGRQGDEGPDPERERLEAKYGPRLFGRAPLLTPERLVQKVAQRDALDQNFARISMDFMAGVCARPGLDVESRYLVQIGQFAVSRSHGHLIEAVRAALIAGVPGRKALESILLTHIYAGDTVLEPALSIFASVARELGLSDGLRRDQIPIDGVPRDLEEERASWPVGLVDDPRRADLMERFGWRGVSTGFRYRGTHHLDSLEAHVEQDESFGRLWETFTYEGMYSRWILDDKTRLLCTMGDCLALGASAAESARDHMEEALLFGNTPREVLEVIFMSGVYFGFPGMSVARASLFSILRETDRTGELGA